MRGKADTPLKQQQGLIGVMMMIWYGKKGVLGRASNIYGKRNGDYLKEVAIPIAIIETG